MSDFAFSSQQDAELSRALAREAEAPNVAKGAVIFYMGSRFNEAKTEEAGRPVFDDVPFIKIHTPGDPTTIYDQPANLDPKNPQSHVRRFPEQWKAFREAGKVPETGTPLIQVSFLARAQVEDLAYRGIKTVEQLAEVPDNLVAQIPNGNSLKAKALKYLDSAKVAANANVQAKKDAELEELRAAVAAMKVQMEAQKQPAAKK